MKYNKNQDDTPISTLRSQVTDVKNIMSQNIDEILESENRLSIFTDRTNDLQTTVSDAHLSWYPSSAQNEQPKASTYQGYCKIILCCQIMALSKNYWNATKISLIIKKWKLKAH